MVRMARYPLVFGTALAPLEELAAPVSARFPGSVPLEVLPGSRRDVLRGVFEEEVFLLGVLFLIISRPGVRARTRCGTCSASASVSVVMFRSDSASITWSRIAGAPMPCGLSPKVGAEEAAEDEEAIGERSGNAHAVSKNYLLTADNLCVWVGTWYQQH